MVPRIRIIHIKTKVKYNTNDYKIITSLCIAQQNMEFCYGLIYKN